MATRLLIVVSVLLLVCVPTTAFVRRRFHTEEEDFADLQRKEAKLVRPLPTKLAEYDINGDGVLEYDEFDQIVKEFNAVAKFDPEGLAQAYSDADVNDNGKLEDDELAALLSEVDAVLSDENSLPEVRGVFLDDNCRVRCERDCPPTPPLPSFQEGPPTPPCFTRCEIIC